MADNITSDGSVYATYEELPGKKKIEPKSDQGSRSNYQYTGNTEDKRTCHQMTWQCNLQNLNRFCRQKT